VAATRCTALKAAELSGALPRLVCKITPVALMRGSRVACVAACSQFVTRLRMSSVSGMAAAAFTSCRTDVRTDRMASKVNGRPNSSSRAAALGSCSKRSMDGSRRRSVIAGIAGGEASAFCYSKGKLDDTQSGCQPDSQRQA